MAPEGRLDILRYSERLKTTEAAILREISSTGSLMQNFQRSATCRRLGRSSKASRPHDWPTPC